MKIRYFYDNIRKIKYSILTVIECFKLFKKGDSVKEILFSICMKRYGKEKWVAGLIVMILCSFIYNILYYIRLHAWNFDYINIIMVAVITYIVFGLLVYKHK